MGQEGKDWVKGSMGRSSGQVVGETVKGWVKGPRSETVGQEVKGIKGGFRGHIGGKGP